MTDETFSLRVLYDRLRDYDGKSVYDEVVLPSTARAKARVGRLQPYGTLLGMPRGYEVEDNPDQRLWEDLWALYALSRINDYFLVSYQIADSFYPATPAQGDEWRGWMAGGGAYFLVNGIVNTVSSEQHLDFFTNLGFTPFGRDAYSPFFYEIVEVEVDEAVTNSIQVDHVYWPGFMFGDMLFARAGVRVRCKPGLLTKSIAEDSVLYFTYWRNRRKVADLAHGWGHNSQWRTEFRRDYLADGWFHYNVDAKRAVSDDNGLSPNSHDDDLDDLTENERVELLVNRCFVTCTKSDEDRWPYDDRYSEKRDDTFASP
jgi:hypothetical protein